MNCPICKKVTPGKTTIGIYRPNGKMIACSDCFRNDVEKCKTKYNNGE